MIKEILHFALHVPRTLAMKRQLTHVELFEALMLRAEKAGLAEWRAALARDIEGQVLEIGCGTGLMFSHYNNHTELTALEFAGDFLEVAKTRAGKATIPIRLFQGDAQTLPFRDATFEFVVIGHVLCSVPSVGKALGEVKRVLKQGGEVRLMEHVRSHKPLNGLVMDMLNPVWLALNNMGCNMNRRTESLLQENGFVLQEVESFKTFTSGLPAFPNRWIRAVPAK